MEKLLEQMSPESLYPSPEQELRNSKDGENWIEDQLIIKQKTLEVGIRLHEGYECEQK